MIEEKVVNRNIGLQIMEEVIKTNKEPMVIAKEMNLLSTITDEKIMELLKAGDSQSIVNMDTKLVEKAGECGFRSILILLGVLNNFNYKTEILSYEAPFGVGYLVANLKLE